MTDFDPNVDFSQFEAEFIEDVPVGDFTNVTVLTDEELLDRFQDLTQEILERREAIRPRTQAGRDLHSERAACRVELSRRKLL